LQNIPREEAFRRLFIAKSGFKICVADLSQAELRLLAHYSRDNVLQQAYCRRDSNTDIHWNTATAVGLSEILDRGDARFAGKTANFSLAYGVWANTFRFTLYKATEGGINLSYNKAGEVVNELKNRFVEVEQWKLPTLAKIRASGYARTIEGRYRRLPDISSSDWKKRSYAERQGINAIIQGSVGDIINRVMTFFTPEWCEKYQVLQAHDEAVWEVPEERIGELETVLSTLGESITEYYGLSVPIVVDWKIGDSWAVK
jgi:DNA polymerase-1